jgi:hypothetical protein
MLFPPAFYRLSNGRILQPINTDIRQVIVKISNVIMELWILV